MGATRLGKLDDEMALAKLFEQQSYFVCFFCSHQANEHQFNVPAPWYALKLSLIGNMTVPQGMFAGCGMFLRSSLANTGVCMFCYSYVYDWFLYVLQFYFFEEFASTLLRLPSSSTCRSIMRCCAVSGSLASSTSKWPASRCLQQQLALGQLVGLRCPEVYRRYPVPTISCTHLSTGKEGYKVTRFQMFIYTLVNTLSDRSLLLGWMYTIIEMHRSVHARDVEGVLDLQGVKFFSLLSKDVAEGSVKPSIFWTRRIPGCKNLHFRSLAHALLKWFVDLEKSDPRIHGNGAWPPGLLGGSSEYPWRLKYIKIY